MGLPEDCISLVQDTSRESANELMHLNGYVDVLIPRGGAGLIRAVARQASVPVIPDRRGRVPHLCGFGCKPRHGGGDFVQREMLAPVGVQRGGMCADPRGGRGGVFAEGRASAGPENGSCAATQRRSRCLARGPGRRRTPTGTRNMTITSSRCAWCGIWTRRWSSLRRTVRSIPSAS